MAIDFNDVMMTPDEGPSVIMVSGEPGATPSFSVGNVESIGPSDPPEVKMSGTITNPILNFKIPRGVSGFEAINDDAGVGDTDYVWSADKSALEIFRSTNNLLDLWKLSVLRAGTNLEVLRNGFRLYSESAMTYGSAYVDILLKPDTNYTMTATMLHNIGQQAVNGWIGYAESTDGGSTYPSNNKVLYSSTVPAVDKKVTFTTTTGYVRLRFYGNGSTSEAYDTSFINLSLEEKNYIASDTKNLLDIRSVKKIQSGISMEILQNGFRVYYTGDLSYGGAYADIHLKPNTNYTLTATIIRNMTQDKNGWIGYVESTDGGSTYPSNNRILYSNKVESVNRKATFSTTTGYVRIRFFGDAATAEPFDTSFVDIFLEEGPHIYDLAENVKAKADIATMKLHRADTSMAYPQNNSCNILFFTDCHEDIARVNRVRELADNWGKTFFDVVIFNGDMPKNVISADVSWYYTAMDGMIVPLLNAVGNHDVYWVNSGGTIEYAEKSVTYEKIIEPIADQAGIVQPTGAAENYLCYYYYDVNSAVRIIVLDGMNWDDDQKTWFRDVLANAKTAGLPVLCCNHCPFPLAVREVVDCTWSRHPWRTNTTYGNNTEMLEEVQTFMESGGIFICWLNGHKHYDNVERMPDYGSQLAVTLGAATTQQSHIMLHDNAELFTYDIMTFITVDTSNGLIKFYRIGCGQEEYGSTYRGLVYNYLTKEIYTSW